MNIRVIEVVETIVQVMPATQPKHSNGSSWIFDPAISGMILGALFLASKLPCWSACKWLCSGHGLHALYGWPPQHHHAAPFSTGLARTSGPSYPSRILSTIHLFHGWAS